MVQFQMISCPLKQTDEIDWTTPLKNYIRQTYGDDPERYSEECNTLNRLRQDMRGAGRESTAGRDLLYRYYGQLELLDLRFPVDESHIKISFTWYDAFTQQTTSQYSLAYEKASIIFNIAAALSCNAASQDRTSDAGQKSAYHAFQASAGMFTYINENFLHAPSKDLSRETVKTLIKLMLAQAQEVFVEKQIADERKVGLIAKLACQAALLYGQALEGVQENVSKTVFDRSWLLVTQLKAHYTSALAQLYQALADDDANNHGIAIARLQAAERDSKEAGRVANTFPFTVAPSSNLSAETRSSLSELTARLTTNIQAKLTVCNKDNDFIYHQVIPAEASLAPIPKLAAAKAIPVSELYQGQDIQRIIGPDIFKKIVPMAVTESASLYDEEKAKLVRAETENVEAADGEMAASLDYLKLPGSLAVLRGDADPTKMIDEDFSSWCGEVAGHGSFERAFDSLQSEKSRVLVGIERCYKSLDQEESTCEKMRSKYGSAWTQQPSSRLNSILRADMSGYKRAIEEASSNDSRLLQTARQYQADFDEMRLASDGGKESQLLQRAMAKSGSGRDSDRHRNEDVISSTSQEESLLDEDFDEGALSVKDQIASVEDLLRKLELVKRDRTQVLKDLKDKAHNDDISNVLILNKKSIANHEQQLFQAELDKFRPHQNRLLQANHKQSALMKELTRTYGALLQDRRVKAEQVKHENLTRQRNYALAKYKRVHSACNDVVDGLMRAQSFYAEIADTVESLEKNVDSFVDNRRAEGAQLLGQIEQNRQTGVDDQAAHEQDRLRGLMERMSMSTNPTTTSNQGPIVSPRSPQPWYHQHSTALQSPRSSSIQHNPINSPDYGPSRQSYTLPEGYQPPPPPPGPPPSDRSKYGYSINDAGELYSPREHARQNSGQQTKSGDPWASLNVWK